MELWAIMLSSLFEIIEAKSLHPVFKTEIGLYELHSDLSFSYLWDSRYDGPFPQYWSCSAFKNIIKLFQEQGCQYVPE